MRTVGWKARFRVEGLAAPGAVGRLEAALGALSGVVRVRVDPVPPAAAPTTAGTVTVMYRPEVVTVDRIRAAIQAAGFPGVTPL